MSQITTTQYNIEALLKRIVLALQKINRKP